MNQVLHIFRKDVRHLWIEIALSFAGLAWMARLDWLHCTPNFMPRWYEELQYPVIFLVFVWWLLVTRLVQEESLVGDRQFWVTRPYEWGKLLGAKLLFIALAIYVPSLIVYFLLLKLASFPILGRLSGAVGINAIALLFLLLPITALASLTRKLAHWLLAMLGMLLWVAGMIYLDSYLARPSITSENIFDFLQAASFFALAAVVVLIQYARRKTPRAWMVMIAAIIVVPVIMIATPFRAAVNHEYPKAADSPFIVALGIPTKNAQTFLPTHKGKVYVILPLQVSGIAQDRIMDPHGAFITIDAPGIHWMSPWQSVRTNLYPDVTNMEITVEVDSQIYEQVKNGPTRVRVMFALTELKQVARQEVRAGESFDLSGVGPCWVRGARGYSSPFVECRSAGISNYIAMSLSSDADICPTDDGAPQPPKGLTARSLNGEDELTPLVPLSTINFYAFSWNQPTDKSVASPQFCPGVPLVFGTYKRTRKVQVEFDLGEIRLSDYYSASTKEDGSIGYGFAVR